MLRFFAGENGAAMAHQLLEVRDPRADLMRTESIAVNLVATIDGACARHAWSEMAEWLKALAGGLPARLELLARSILDLLDDEEFDLAAQVWAHLHEATIFLDRVGAVGMPLASAPEGRSI